jgi:uncharacterized protein (DUF2141 family)
MTFKIAPTIMLWALIAGVCNMSGTKVAKGRLTITIDGIKTQRGSVRIAMYNSAETFLDDKKYAFTHYIPVQNTAPVQMSFEIPFGTYAISCYHDINDNRDLDKSVWGYPIEPYALSNNIDAKWRKPTFQETKITFTENQKSLNLQLKLWKER